MAIAFNPFLVLPERFHQKALSTVFPVWILEGQRHPETWRARFVETSGSCDLPGLPPDCPSARLIQRHVAPVVCRHGHLLRNGLGDGRGNRVPIPRKLAFFSNNAVDFWGVPFRICRRLSHGGFRLPAAERRRIPSSCRRFLEPKDLTRPLPTLIKKPTPSSLPPASRQPSHTLIHTPYEH